MVGFRGYGSNKGRYSILIGIMIALLLGNALIASYPGNDNSNYRSITNPNGDLFSCCPAYPGPIEARQPNNYSFFLHLVGDEWSHMTYYLPTNTEGGVPSPAHPIQQIDGWWYFCYWNESQCWVTFTYPDIRPLNQSSDINITIMPPLYPITFAHPLLISTEVKIGDPLPTRVFTFTQVNGRSFKAKLRGPLENPHWETPSGKLIIQVPTSTAEGLKGIWFYAECTSDNLIQSTGVPVNEHGTPVNWTQSPLDPPINPPDIFPPEKSDSSIPGFTMLLIIPAFIGVCLCVWKKRSLGLQKI
jgi:hypothetical protein